MNTVVPVVAPGPVRFIYRYLTRSRYQLCTGPGPRSTGRFLVCTLGSAGSGFYYIFKKIIFHFFNYFFITFRLCNSVIDYCR